MTKPLSRFTGQHPKPRPSHTLIVPDRQLTGVVIDTLLDAGEIFTVEPSPTAPGVWHLGVFDSGRAVVVKVLQERGY